jgi:hypothetical protein
MVRPLGKRERKVTGLRKALVGLQSSSSPGCSLNIKFFLFLYLKKIFFLLFLPLAPFSFDGGYVHVYVDYIDRTER